MHVHIRCPFELINVGGEAFDVHAVRRILLDDFSRLLEVLGERYGLVEIVPVRCEGRREVVDGLPPLLACQI